MKKVLHDSIYDCYKDYIEEADQIKANAKPLDGLFGLHSASKTNPAHEEFFYEVEELLKKIAADDTFQDVFGVAELVMFSPAQNRENFGFWYLYAAIQHVEKLFPRLTKDEIRTLMTRFEAEYAKKDWLPVHVKLHKQMKKLTK